MKNVLNAIAAGAAALMTMGAFVSANPNASPIQLSAAHGPDRAASVSESVVTLPGLVGEVECVCGGVWSVGDQVIRVADTAGSGGPPIGSIGTVVCGETTFIDLPILICWDGFLAGHDGQGFCACPGEQLPPDSDCGWYVDCADIQLLPCPADLSRDGQVDGFDLAMLLGHWTGATMYAPCPPHSEVDLDSDCRINGFDLAILLGEWGPCDS